MNTNAEHKNLQSTINTYTIRKNKLLNLCFPSMIYNNKIRKASVLLGIVKIISNILKIFLQNAKSQVQFLYFIL